METFDVILSVIGLGVCVGAIVLGIRLRLKTIKRTEFQNISIAYHNTVEYYEYRSHVKTNKDLIKGSEFVFEHVHFTIS